jgi:hypothetical protein
MRPIATLASAPLRFPDAVVASPRQRSMQYRLPGYDVTFGPEVRGRLMARLRRPPQGQSAEHQGADAAGGGDCRRAAGRAGDDDGASEGIITGRPDDCPLANFQISTKTLWSAVRAACRQPGTPKGRARGPSPVRAVQFVNLDKDPMERRTVGLAAGRCASGGSAGPVPGRAVQFVNLDKDPMERRAVGLAAGRCASGGSPGPDPGREAQFANFDKDPMERRAVGLAAGRCASGGSPGPVPGRAAQFANLDKDPMERRAVGLAASRRTRAAILILAHLVATSSWPDLFRPSVAAPCCGDGRNKSGHDVERPYRPTKTRIAGARNGSPGPVPRRAAQFANLDKDPMERSAVGRRWDWRGCRSASRAGPAARCQSRPRPYGMPSGGVGGGSGSRGCQPGACPRAAGQVGGGSRTRSHARTRSHEA